MNKMKIQRAMLFALLFGISVLVSCIPRATESKAIRIRYVYLPAIVEYLAQGDPAAKEIEKQKESVQKSIENIKMLIEKGGSEIPDAVLRGDLKKYENELKAILAQEEKLKSAYYREINSAIGSVARRYEINLVFNRGEELVYAERDFDITERVIHELSNRKNRISPHSR
ncbi:MAG: OmpH family outer membrane protein [Spirochaetes bacterium]|nr:OmpH family outer membrane protein [Spirochaetota bacterium]